MSFGRRADLAGAAHLEFLRFAARHRGRQAIRLQLADPGADTVLAS